MVRGPLDESLGSKHRIRLFFSLLLLSKIDGLPACVVLKHVSKMFNSSIPTFAVLWSSVDFFFRLLTLFTRRNSRRCARQRLAAIIAQSAPQEKNALLVIQMLFYATPGRCTGVALKKKKSRASGKLVVDADPSPTVFADRRMHADDRRRSPYSRRYRHIFFFFL